LSMTEPSQPSARPMRTRRGWPCNGKAEAYQAAVCSSARRAAIPCGRVVKPPWRQAALRWWGRRCRGGSGLACRRRGALIRVILGRGPQAVEQMPGLFDPTHDPPQLPLESKETMHPDVERARPVHFAVVKGHLAAARAQAEPPPAVPRLE